MTDNVPVVSEFGRGSCTCYGDYTGCAVCSVASTLLRYGRSIPRLADGTPSMRTLGSAMGAKHRRAVAGNRHGLSLAGSCSPPHTGTNWCAYCAYLELKARGLNVGYGKLTDAQIAGHLKAGHSLIVPGLYGRIPIVARNSYDSVTPARGRSDTNFSSWHMIAAHGVKLVGTQITKVTIADSDFGSASRPVMPPHSEWAWATFLSFYHATGGWGITYVNAKPPSAPAPAPVPTAKYRASVPKGLFFRYFVNSDGVITHRSDPPLSTGGFSADCSPGHVYPDPANHRSVELVKLLSGARKGQYILARYSNQP